MTAAHRPTAETRAIVERACGAGFTQPQIAQLLGLSERSLRKHYRNQLDKGAVKTTAAVVGRLYDLAMQQSDARVSLQACSLWLRARCGWRESDPAQAAAMTKVEITSQPVLRVPGLLDAQEWNRLAEEHRAQLVHLTSAGQRPEFTVMAKSDGPVQRLQEAERRFQRVVHGGGPRKPGEPLD